jgi:hypothetical protein
MVAKNEDAKCTAFTVSVDLHVSKGITTGISASGLCRRPLRPTPYRLSTNADAGAFPFPPFISPRMAGAPLVPLTRAHTRTNVRTLARARALSLSLSHVR